MKKHSVLTKVVALLALVILPIGFFVSYYAFFRVKTFMLDTEIATRQNAIVEDSKHIAEGLESTQYFVQMIGTHLGIAEYLQHPTEAKKKEITTFVDNIDHDNKNYLAVYILNATGSALISSDHTFVGNNYGFRPYFVKARAGKPAVDMALGKTSKTIGYYLSHPIQDMKGNIYGVAVIKLASSAINLTHNGLLQNKESTVMVTDLNGVILSSTKKDRLLKSVGPLFDSELDKIKKSKSYLDTKIKPLWYAGAQQVIRNYKTPQTLHIYDDEDHEHELLSIVRVENYPLYFVTEIEITNYLEKLTEFALVMASAVFVAAVLAFVVVISVIGRMLLPLNVLRVAAERIGKGDFSRSIELRTGDEFEELAGVFNTAQSRLRDLYMNLEKKVKERTAEISRILKDEEQKNEDLARSRLAVMNILEDERVLEEELKQEKENVDRKIVIRTKELATEKSRLISLIESLPRGIALFNRENILIHHNEKLEKMLKISHSFTFEELDSTLGNTVSLKDYVSELREQKPGRLKEREVQIGTQIYSVYIALVMPENETDPKNHIGFLVAVSDVTEVKVLARSKDEFFSIASHELRTPLTAIRGNTSMILEYYANELKNNDVKQMVTDTHTASVQLISIVNDFLDMSRLEQGKMTYKLESVTVRPLVSLIATELAANASKKGVIIQNAVEDGIIVLADAGKLEQILTNLVGNALKFTENGSILVNTKVRKSSVEIRIEDSGQGIPLANQSLLFHKFQQAGDSTITRNTVKGTGLGLYISRLMAEGMRGTLVLERSEEGKGSVFTVTLPITG